MCFNYINANVLCCKSVQTNFENGVVLSPIINSVTATKQNNNKFEVEDFSIVTFINIRGTQNNQNKLNPLDMGEKLCFKIRLTRLATESKDQLSYDLSEFNIDLSKKENIKRACFNYVERIEITNVKRLFLENKGNYVIKILIKEQKDTLYQIQMVHPILIE